MRLNAYLRRCGISSRRSANELIQAGKVTVNGSVVTAFSYLVQPSDIVLLEGKPLHPKTYTYLALNKPKGVTCTTKDKFAEKTIVELLPAKFSHLYPVGRLDKDTTGLIFLTNDGSFCNTITHPRFQVEKEYIVTLNASPKPDELRKALRGITQSGEFLRILRLIPRNPPRTTFSVIIQEGKKREIRRIFNALGYEVIFLKRIRIGNFYLGNLRSGEWRMISPGDIKRIVALRHVPQKKA